MKKCLLILLTIILMAPLAKASHIVGGDISVNWVGPGQNDFQIQVRVFRSCQSGSANMPGSVSIDIHDLVTYATTQTINISNPVITTNLPFGDACFTPTGLCVDLGVFTQNVTIPNNPNGYFLEYQICCRNSGITNLATPTSDGMTFYCEIPDPGNAAAINNSNPDMGIYPLDAYFCVNSPKQFQFNVTDVDNDSLVYSLVTPLDDGAMNAAPTFPYNNVGYSFGYSLANMVGGASPMVIDQNTGVITASPSLIGTYVFGVKVEEFRNGVKIGETRRDAQYEALACSSGNPPSFLNVVPTNGGTLSIPYNKLYCKDLIFNDINITDTLFIEMISPIFDTAVMGLDTATPRVDGSLIAGNHHYYYDWNFSTLSWNDSIVIPPNQDSLLIIGNDTSFVEWNIGTVASRFCWTPPCHTIDSIYPFQINAFSLGCDGKAQDSIIFDIQVIPPSVDLKNPGDKPVYFGSEYCRNIVFHDSSIVDMLNIEINSDIFNEGAEFPTLSNNYDYENFVYPNGPYEGLLDGNELTTGVANGAQNPTTVAKRFCWTPDCEHIGNTYNVEAILSSVDCPSGIQDTINFDYIVLPPEDSLDVIPNVITPNGDGINDIFTLGYTNENGDRVGGISNPCHDEINVQIFNRWGLLIYESNEYPEFEWDGTNKSGSKVIAGTYFVLISGIYGNEPVTLDQRSVTVLDPQ